MNNTPRRLITLVSIALSLGGCTTSYVKPLPETPSVAATPISLSGLNPKMVALSSITIDIPVGAVLGQNAFGWGGGCTEKTPITYMRGTTRADVKFYEDTFKDVMARVGIPVQQTIQRFEGEEIRKADLQIAAVVKDMTLNLCYPTMNLDKFFAKGEAYVNVEWSVFSPLDKAVIYTTTTSGRTPRATESRLGEGGLIREALRNALLVLVAQQRFADAVLKGHESSTASATTVLRFKQPPARVGQIGGNLDELRDGVVTIQANNGVGSGFAIGRGEYVLTGAHVVSGSSFVKVLGSRGQESYGEVIRRNLPRDVALIKLNTPLFRPLHLSRSYPKEGTEVYAIGSPLGKQLESTVTRGIVSGIRRHEEKDFIQSDVTVLPGSSGGPLLDERGNVVGITNSGITVHDTPVGMNFFIPVRDVFSSLSLVEE